VLRLSVLDMTDETMFGYVDIVPTFTRLFDYALPSSVALLARYVRLCDLHHVKLDAAFLASETAHSSRRELIEQVFGPTVNAGCGMTDRLVDAVQCPAHSGYHENMEFGVLELLDADNQPITESGVLICDEGTGSEKACMWSIRDGTGTTWRCARPSPASAAGRRR
jgi:phenylacetate-coenzyme A ligase PaaK-like adenylate-forming protein